MNAKSISTGSFLTRSMQWFSVLFALIIDYLSENLPQQGEPFLDGRGELMHSDLYINPYYYL